FWFASSSKIPFFATIPITMISPINEDTLNVVLVINRAKKTPEVESTADDKIASGAENARNSSSSTTKTSTRASSSTVSNSRNDFCCSLKVPAYSTRIGSFRSFTAFCTAKTPVPRSIPSSRAATTTSRCKLSRITSICPGTSLISDMAPSVVVPPAEFTSSVFFMDSSEERLCLGYRTRTTYGRSLITTGVLAGSPSTIADVTILSWSVVKPAFAALTGSTVKTTAGPLVVLSMPLSTSTTGFLLLI